MTELSQLAQVSAPNRIDERQAGFVLVSVVVMLALIAGVIGTVTRIVTQDVRAQQQLDKSFAAQLRVDGVARHVAWKLIARRPDAFRKGATWRCRYSNTEVHIEIQPVQGLVDLNAASLNVLERLLAGVGETPSRAERLAAAIGDFRDADDNPRVRGAERDAYRKAGLDHSPKNAPFELTAELDQVLGMNLDLLHRIEPFVTVHSGLPTIDRASMPSALKDRLVKTTENSANDLLGDAPTNAFRVVAVAREKGRVLAARTNTVLLDRRQPAGFRTVDWQRRDISVGRRHAATQSQDCVIGEDRSH